MTGFDHTTDDGLRAAVTQLRQSLTGRDTLRCLSEWLPESGASLDYRNQEAAFALICGAWGPKCGMALDFLCDAIEPVPA